jgi:hypothetical protein
MPSSKRHFEIIRNNDHHNHLSCTISAIGGVSITTFAEGQRDVAITCTGCKYLSAFGTICLLGRERQGCREKLIRDEPNTLSDLLLNRRIEAVNTTRGTIASNREQR